MHHDINCCLHCHELDLMLCHVQLNMVKKASTPEPASMAAEKPAGKPAAGISTTKPANKKRIAARVVKATKEDVPPEPVITPEQVPDQKVRPPGMYM